MSLLVDSQKFINIKYHYLEIVGQHMTRFQFIHSQEEYEKHKDNPKLKELNTGWKILAWVEHNEINSECINYDTNEKGINVTGIDFIKFRDMKLKMCLKTWDLKDDNGQAIPITKDKIDLLNPDVANELLNGFEKVTEVGADELGNLPEAPKPS